MNYDLKLNKGQHTFKDVSKVEQMRGDYWRCECTCGLRGQRHKDGILILPENVDLKKLIRCPDAPKIKIETKITLS